MSADSKRTQDAEVNDGSFDNSDHVSVGSSGSIEESTRMNNSHSNSGTTTKDGGIGAGDSSTSRSMAIAQEESAQVFKLRLLVLLVIFLAAIAVSLAVYFLTANSQADEFENQFEGASNKVLTNFEEIVKGKLTAIGSIAVQASLFASSQNLSWPFITLGDFELRAAVARELSGALFIRLVPLVVQEKREAWEKYSVENLHWMEEAVAYNKKHGLGFDRRLQDEAGSALNEDDKGEVDFSSGIGNKIYHFDETYTAVAVDGPGPFFPLWQESPTFGRDITNFDTMKYPLYAPYMLKAYETGEISIGGLDTAAPGNTTDPDLSTSYFSFLESMNAGKRVEYKGDPMSSVFLPVFDDFQADDRKVVAMVFAVFKWAFYFQGLLPTNFPGVVVVLQNTCEGPFTYKVVGEEVEYLGKGDLHTDFSRREDLVQSANFETNNDEDNAFGVKLNQDICAYELSVYPSKELEDTYITWLPLVVSLAVAMVFVLTAVIFLIFNGYVERRQRLVMNQAVKSTALVTSLFPEEVRNRLMDGEYISGKTRLKSFLNDQEDANLGAPIADLFPHCTVFFADIANFTSWSSTREPSAVFVLLETIYQNFDFIAKRRGVFKVETIGDSYVAVCGLPNPNDKHAVVMARFAQSCLEKFSQLTKTLEHTLGDTDGLGLRIGLHSGPVTAGVLRGERPRFQLFGDSVNTASRMESSSETGKIHISGSTAQLLIEAGKEHWVQRRPDAVNVKGKGIMESFWLNPKIKYNASESSSSTEILSNPHQTASQPYLATLANNPSKQQRLVKWMTDLLIRRIENIVARQDPDKVGKCKPSDLVYHVPEGSTSLDEVAEVIKLPKFDALAAKRAKKCGKVKLSPEVEKQLEEIVIRLADMYKPNPFHNFEHACHVTMSVDKLMGRIVTPDMDHDTLDVKDHTGLAAHVHNYTHGINSDPITLLAVVFSALVHDTDHRGVSNAQLATEEEQMALRYKNKSIAEQNSLDLAWDLLMQDNYAKLRATLFVDRSEMIRFRQVLVNVVLATDIFDKELNDLRKTRWARAFSGTQQDELQNDLKATIVIEHIIQASDVAHTMQHWHIYRKWNERLFAEMYVAFKQGRMAKSPAEFWYKGEIGFFDHYIIPLAKKLKDCNVFGVSSDECLNYAMRNRQEWEERGMEATAEMLQKIESLAQVP